MMCAKIINTNDNVNENTARKKGTKLHNQNIQKTQDSQNSHNNPNTENFNDNQSAIPENNNNVATAYHQVNSGSTTDTTTIEKEGDTNSKTTVKNDGRHDGRVVVNGNNTAAIATAVSPSSAQTTSAHVAASPHSTNKNDIDNGAKFTQLAGIQSSSTGNFNAISYQKLSNLLRFSVISLTQDLIIMRLDGARMSSKLGVFSRTT